MFLLFVSFTKHIFDEIFPGPYFVFDHNRLSYNFSIIRNPFPGVKRRNFVLSLAIIKY